MSDVLLDWYDKNARVMPWRVPPDARAAGIVPDPYCIWMSEVMLQQTTVAAVKEYFLRFTARWPTVTDLAVAQDADVMAEWAGLGYYARARNLLKCARVIADEHAGIFPRDHGALLKLPGIGPYTAAAISAIAFDAPETVLDGNVERVVSRLFNDPTPLPAAKPVFMGYAQSLTPNKRSGDYAQAIMDLGATVCTPKNPACGICPWMGNCQARAAETATELPKKSPKKPKQTRLGIAYIAQREDGAVLLETRPDKGLLGGMLGWPTSDWSDDPQPAPPLNVDWNDTAQEARHTFTHFHLKLRVLTAQVDMRTQPKSGAFKSNVKLTDLPTVMRKAFAVSGLKLK